MRTLELARKITFCLEQRVQTEARYPLVGMHPYLGKLSEQGLLREYASVGVSQLLDSRSP